ncbi:MAG: alpha/beta hydrolase [Candidatus Heimdallarchaeota archaeon]|nr:MAG: alpha/beta hydrolase [Candidatus Heimdallarchaeota archaeon]
MEHKQDYFVGGKNHKIFYQSWSPSNPKAIIQIIHGFAEHSGRYKYLIDKLTSANFIVYINDHRGHGRSEGRRNHIRSLTEFAEDCYKLTMIIRGAQPNLALFLIGHSMGSSIAQRYAIQHQAEIKGLILSGTGSKVQETPKIMVKLASIMSKIFPTFSGPTGIDPNNLSSDSKSVENYRNDPLINYKKSTAAMGMSMFKHYSEVKDKISSIKIPVLFQSGEEDVMMLDAEEIFEDLTIEDKTMKTYPNCKHEMYTESPQNKDLAINDLISWIITHLQD